MDRFVLVLYHRKELLTMPVWWENQRPPKGTIKSLHGVLITYWVVYGNIDRLLKFFHWQSSAFAIKWITEDPTMPRASNASPTQYLMKYLCINLSFQLLNIYKTAQSFSRIYLESFVVKWKFLHNVRQRLLSNTGWAKKLGHSVLQKYCSDLHDCLQKSKSFNS